MAAIIMIFDLPNNYQELKHYRQVKNLKISLAKFKVAIDFNKANFAIDIMMTKEVTIDMLIIFVKTVINNRTTTIRINCRSIVTVINIRKAAISCIDYFAILGEAQIQNNIIRSLHFEEDQKALF